MKANVIIVDDHPIVRQGLKLLINQAGDLEVCCEAEDAPTALSAIEEMRPDIAMVDISLKGMNGLELLRDMRARFPEVPVLILSMHDETLYAERALRAGAKGYIMKQEATERVVLAIRRVLSGEIYVSDNMAARLLSKLIGTGFQEDKSPVASLSDRELQVFQMIGHGVATREIADELHLSVKTIETYREHIKRKLALKSGMELVHYAIQWVQAQQGA